MMYAFKESSFTVGIQQFLTFLGTCRDPLAFEYISLSSAPAVLGFSRPQPPQSTAVLAFIAQKSRDYDNSDSDSNSNSDSDSDSNSEYIDIDGLIDPQLKALSTTQLGLQRLEEAPNAYQPRTLLPQLY